MSHILNLYRGTFRLAHEVPPRSARSAGGPAARMAGCASHRMAGRVTRQVALGARIQGPDAIARACGGSVTRVRGSPLGTVRPIDLAAGLPDATCGPSDRLRPICWSRKPMCV
jgi:hypothetical protein